MKQYTEQDLDRAYDMGVEHGTIIANEKEIKHTHGEHLNRVTIDYDGRELDVYYETEEVIVHDSYNNPTEQTDASIEVVALKGHGEDIMSLFSDKVMRELYLQLADLI